MTTATVEIYHMSSEPKILLDNFQTVFWKPFMIAQAFGSVPIQSKQSQIGLSHGMKI